MAVKQYTLLTSLAANADALGAIQTAINNIINEMQDEQNAPDWETLRVHVKDLATGWTIPGAETVTAYGVVMSSM